MAKGRDPSATAFVEFWNYVVDKGIMNRNTARSLGAAAKAVLSVEEGWENLDITSFDAKELLTRFKNLRAREYTPQSLDAYDRRFRQALRMYQDYLENPAGWKVPGSKRTRRQRNTRKLEEPRISETGGASLPAAVFDSGSKLISYPFPLRDDCVVQLRLPADLSEEDVLRLTAFMRSLVLAAHQ